MIYLRRNSAFVNPPKALNRPFDPIVASIGAFADFPLWDEFLAAIAANRKLQNALDN